jgi:hypothetical protein
LVRTFQNKPESRKPSLHPMDGEVSHTQSVQLKGKTFGEQEQALSPNLTSFSAQQDALRPSTNDVQMKGGEPQSDDVHEVAASGLQGSGGSLPYLDKIQASFGSHDVSNVRSYSGGQAATANEQLGSMAYASGNAVAFKGSTSLHTAAHEAAHIVQQRSGVSLSGGVGQSGDSYEQHADAVADLVVQGESAESLLGKTGGGGGGGTQMAVQKFSPDEPAMNAAPAAAPQADQATGIENQPWHLTGNLIGRPPVRDRESPPNKHVVENQSTYLARKQMAQQTLQAQRTLAQSMLDPSGNVVDYKYWFARVYSYVTENEILQADNGTFHYPSYVMLCVNYFDKIYVDNIKQWEAGNKTNVEEHWRQAFEECEENEKITLLQAFLAAGGGAAGGVLTGGNTAAMLGGGALGNLAGVVHDSVASLVVSMQAHIRYDLPRAEAWVFNSNYKNPGAGGVNWANQGAHVETDNFLPDFMSMGPVFETAAAQMNDDMADKFGVPVDLMPKIAQDLAMTYYFDADMATERADTWQRAEALESEGRSSADPYQVVNGQLVGDVTAADNMSGIKGISNRNLRPSMDSSATVMDDDAVRADVAQSGRRGVAAKSMTERMRMLRGLIRGATLDADEATIIEILRASLLNGDHVTVIDGGDAYTLARDTHGAEWVTLRAFLCEHYYANTSTAEASRIVQLCANGATSEWEEVMICDILEKRSASDVTAIVNDVGYEHLVDNVSGAEWGRVKMVLRNSYYLNMGYSRLRSAVWNLLDGGTGDWAEIEIISMLWNNSQHAHDVVVSIGYSRFCDDINGSEWGQIRRVFKRHVYPKMTTNRKIRTINWLCDGVTNEWAEEEIIEILRATNWSQFRSVVRSVGKSTLNWNLTGREQEIFDVWVRKAGI